PQRRCHKSRDGPERLSMDAASVIFPNLRKWVRNRLIGKNRGGQGMQRTGWRWPGGKPIAVIFNICLEAWSDGKAPGISPMGNPLPAGALDTMAISWAAYGVKRGIYRLLDALAAHKAKASVMTSAIIAERAPEAV